MVSCHLDSQATLCQVKTGAQREYTLKKRAQKQAETRVRIVEAVVALHEEVGPARTTVVEIADRAKVSRPTVYSHFPDEQSLIAACSRHWSHTAKRAWQAGNPACGWSPCSMRPSDASGGGATLLRTS